MTLTHVPDDGLKLNGSSQLQFGDSGTQISQSADGILDLESDNVVEINGLNHSRFRQDSFGSAIEKVAHSDNLVIVIGKVKHNR